jgi:hypothetical protein
MQRAAQRAARSKDTALLLDRSRVLDQKLLYFFVHQ